MPVLFLLLQRLHHVKGQHFRRTLGSVVHLSHLRVMRTLSHHLMTNLSDAACNWLLSGLKVMVLMLMLMLLLLLMVWLLVGRWQRHDWRPETTVR